MKLLQGQLWHLLCLSLLLIIVYYYSTFDAISFQGEYLGLSSKSWFFIALLSPVLHQVFVVICWRLELHSKGITKLLGEHGFIIFKVLFAILILSRLVTIISLALSTAYTLSLNKQIAYLFAVILFVPSVYLFYSVKKYFGMDRAFGIDHFRPEALRDKPFVKKGIFKYTTNGMYVYGFLILYVPGLLMLSKAALVVALFNHAYIWVHYFCTELPDIKVIYGD